MKGEIPKEYSKLEKKTRRKNDLHIYNIKFIEKKNSIKKNTTFFFYLF